MDLLVWSMRGEVFSISCGLYTTLNAMHYTVAMPAHVHLNTMHSQWPVGVNCLILIVNSINRKTVQDKVNHSGKLGLDCNKSSDVQ